MTKHRAFFLVCGVAAAIILIALLAQHLVAPDQVQARMAPLQDVRGLIDDPALLGYWTLDETGGNALDSSESQADMIPTGGVLYAQPGQVGNAMGFDGSSAYLTSASDVLNVRGSFSVGGWVYVAADDASGLYRIILGNGDWNGYTAGMALALEGDDSPSLWLRTTQSVEPWMYRAQGPPLSREQWHLLTGVYDGEAGTMKLFVDGALQATTPITPTRVDPTSVRALQMGATPSLGGSAYFKGRLDEVFYLSRALSDSEVAQLYAGSFTPAPIVVPPWHPKFGLSPMGARLQSLAGTPLRGQGYQYWWRGADEDARSLIDPANELRQAMVSLLNQADSMSDAQFEAALDETAMLLWTHGDYPLLSQGSLPRSLSDTDLITMTAAQNEIEARGLYVSNLYEQPLRVQVTPTGFPLAVQGAITVSYVAPETSADALLSFVRPLEAGDVVEIPARQSRQLWIEVDTTGLSAGSYAGSLSLTPEPYGDGFQPPAKSVAVGVTVADIGLQAQPPFDTYTYNYGGSAHADHQARNRVNWLSMSEPAVTSFDPGSQTITLDFTATDGSVADAQRNGMNLLSIYGFLLKLDQDYGLSWNDPSHQPLILSYFTQWVDHLENDLGLTPDDYVIYLWDEPEGWGTSGILADVCPQLKALRPNTRLGNTLTQPDAQTLSGCLDLFIPGRYTLEMVPDTLAFYQNLQTQGKTVWTYDQKAGPGSAPMISPVDLYRFRPWKTVWNMGLDGASFWSSWYAHETNGTNPAKGFYAWREGLEDTEWILRLQARVDYLLGQPGYDGIPYANIQAAQAILDESNQDPYFTRDYTTDTVTGEQKLNDLRRRAISALINLYPQPAQTCYARLNDDPTDYFTVQAAVDAAQPGDTIKIAGTCTDVETRAGLPQIAYVDKSLSFQGGYTTTNWTTPDPDIYTTTLDAQGQGRVFYAIGDVDLSLAGLRLTGGDATGLDGYYWDDRGNGGGGYVISATFSLSNCTVISNVATYGGGLHLRHSDALIQNSSFVDNRATDDGGGLLAYDQRLQVIGSTFSRNQSESGGGGLSALLNSDVLLRDNLINHNQAWGGGGVNLLLNSFAALENNIIIHNTAERGGGVESLHSIIVLTDNTLSHNTAADHGGGAYVGASHARFQGNLISNNQADDWGGGGLVLDASDVTLDGDQITDNSANQYGGGVNIYYDSEGTFRNVIVAGNSAGIQGSGIYVLGSRVSLQHGTLANNTGGDGSGVHVTSNGYGYWAVDVTQSSALTLSNAIVTGHSTGLYVDSGSRAALDYTLWWNNGTDWSGGGTVGSSHDLSGDPAFVDGASGDYHLSSGSAALDAGANAGVRRDLDGDVRAMGLGYDVGADEYPGVGLDLAYRAPAPAANPGDSLNYTLVVTGAGTGTATSLSLTGAVDAAQRVTAVTPSQGTCTITDGGWGGGFTCTPGDLAPGARVDVALTVEIAGAVAPWQPITTTVTATANGVQNTATASLLGQTCQASVDGGPAHTTIQAAVDAAAPGSVVEVSGVCLGASQRAGTWQQVYIDKNLSLRGSPGLTPTLDALRQGYGLHVTGGGSVTLEDLRVTGGDVHGPSTHGGGLHVEAATATLRNLEVDHCWGYGGGGVDLEQSSVSLSQSRIHHNTSYGMFSFYGGGGVRAHESDLDLHHNDIYQNTTLRQADGAGLCAFKSTGQAHHNQIHHNVSTLYGGGIYWSGDDAVLNNNAIYSNTAALGGGLAVNGGATFEANQIRANTAYEGGGIHVRGDTPRFINTLVSQNQASHQGSGLFLSRTTAQLIHTTLADNPGSSAIYVDTTYVWEGVTYFSQATFSNTLISGHTLGISLTQGNTITLANTLWWDNAADWAGDGSLIHTGDYSGDPAFVDPANGDYHLSAASAALDRGLLTGVATDIDGDPRLMGTAPDLGADEYPQETPSCGYFNDFEGTLGSELSPNQTDVTPLGARRFWGQFVNQTATLSLAGCTPHDYVTLEFDLYVIRTWDGNSPSWGPDVFDVSLGSGETLLHTTFSIARGYGMGDEQGQAYPDNYPGLREYPARTRAVEDGTLGYQDPYQPPGTYADAVYHVSLTFPHTDGDLVVNFSASGLTSLADESWGIDNLQVTPHSGDPTHLIGVVAFDNNLSAYADDLIDRARTGTLHNRSTRATLLVDRQGDDNTEVLTIVDGVVTPADVPGLAAEVDTGDPDALATFLTWARDQQPGYRDVVSLVGHGAGLTPEVPAQSGIQSAFPPLPRGHDFTPVDVTSGSYLSTPELGRALSAATNAGADPWDLLFFDQCFAGNLETLYQVQDTADVLVASPNYAWAAFAYHDYLVSTMPSASGDEVAQSLVAAYGRHLDDAHPYSLFWLRGADVSTIAASVSGLGQALQAALIDPTTRDRVLSATLASQFVDTTLCQGDLALCPPDEMMDVRSFAGQVQAAFEPGSAVHTSAQAVQSALDAVHVSGQGGSPWVKPEVTWDVADVGLTMLAPLTPTLSPETAWRASIYTETAPLTAVWSPAPTHTLRLTRPWAFTTGEGWDDFISAWYRPGSLMLPTVGQWCYAMPPVSGEVTTPTLPIYLSADPGWLNVQLDWNPTNLPEVAGYRVMRAISGTQDYVAVGETGAPGYFDDDPALVSGTAYCYRVEALWPGGTSAATSNVACASFGKLALWVPDVWAAPGETAVVPVNIRNADGLRLAATDIWLDFDGAVIEPLGVSSTTLTAGYSWAYAITSTQAYSRVRIAAMASPPPQLYGDGSLFWLTVRVQASSGLTSPLNLREFIEGVGGSTIYAPEDPYHPVPLVLDDGVFYVGEAYVLGDLNGNGVVQAIDAWLALKIAAGEITPTWQQRQAGDVNGNGVVDAADATLILHYAAHGSWPSSLGHPPEGQSPAAPGELVVSLDDVGGAPGTVVETTVRVEGLADGAGGEFIIAYDRSLVQAITGVEPTGLAADFALEFYDTGQGLLHIAMADDGAVSGSGPLATISIHLAADAPIGSSAPLALAGVRLHDDRGRDFATSELQRSIDRQNGVVYVQYVQQPGTRIYLPMVMRSRN